MERSKRDEATLRRLAESYRTAQDRARARLLAHVRRMLEADYSLTEVANIAGTTKQALWDQLRRDQEQQDRLDREGRE